MKQFYLILVFVFLFVEAKTHHYFADYLVAGTSLTYIRNGQQDIYRTDYGYDEYTWNINAGIRVSKRLFCGLQLLNVYSSQISTKKNYYSVYGMFTQFTFYTFGEHRVFVESSLNKGNYCTSADLPSRVHNLYYLGGGGGYELPIRKIQNLYLDLSFISYLILNNIQDKYAYTQYIVGLNYRFNER